MNLFNKCISCFLNFFNRITKLTTLNYSFSIIIFVIINMYMCTNGFLNNVYLLNTFLFCLSFIFWVLVETKTINTLKKCFIFLFICLSYILNFLMINMLYSYICLAPFVFFLLWENYYFFSSKKMQFYVVRSETHVIFTYLILVYSFLPYSSYADISVLLFIALNTICFSFILITKIKENVLFSIVILSIFLNLLYLGIFSIYLFLGFIFYMFINIFFSTQNNVKSDLKLSYFEQLKQDSFTISNHIENDLVYINGIEKLYLLQIHFVFLGHLYGLSKIIEITFLGFSLGLLILFYRINVIFFFNTRTLIKVGSACINCFKFGSGFALSYTGLVLANPESDLPFGPAIKYRIDGVNYHSRQDLYLFKKFMRQNNSNFKPVVEDSSGFPTIDVDFLKNWEDSTKKQSKEYREIYIKY
jgi:hypothetical protein